MNLLVAAGITTFASAIASSVVITSITAVTSASNGLFTLIKHVSQSTSTWGDEIKMLIQKSDLEMRIKMIQFILSELKITNNTPTSLYYCINKIYEAIKDISDELSKINYRMQYNDNLWFGSSFRAYGFKNCYTRLETKITTLEKRYSMLIEILSIEKKMYRNKDLENMISESIMFNNMSADDIKKNRDDVHKNLKYLVK